MSKTQKTVVLSDMEIDNLVIEQADDDNAWEELTTVEREPATLILPPDLAARVAFFAQLHDATLDAWLLSIIEERLLYEQAIFARVKRAVATRTNASKAA